MSELIETQVDYAVEKHVIGAMLLDPEAVALVRSVLKPEHFYHDRHRMICEAAYSLDDQNKPVDIILVLEKLQELKTYDSVGGDSYLMEIAAEVVSSANIEEHAQLIFDWAMRRGLVNLERHLLGAIQDKALSTDDIIAKTSSILDTLARKQVKDAPTPLGATMKEVMDDVELRAKKMGLGMKTGFRDLDDFLEGIEGGRTYVIGGIPGSGKTMLGTSIGKNLAVKYKEPGLIFSGEMSKMALGYRLLSAEAEIALRHLKRGTLPTQNYSALLRGYKALLDVPIWIDRPARMTPALIRAKTRLVLREHKIKWVMLDYFQLMSSDRKFGSRYEEMTQASVDLLNVALDLNLPFFIMAQLDKDSSKGGTPTMGNVKETGQLIQDAHAVLLMHRPTMFDKKLKEEKSEDPFNALGTDYSIKKSQPEDLAWCIVEKNRDGKTGAFKMRFDGLTQRYMDW